MNGQMAQDLKLVRGHVVTPLSLKASLAKHYIFTVANVYNMMLRLIDRFTELPEILLADSG